MYKRILVHVDADDPGAADRVRFAADLARDYHACLIGMAAGLPEPAVEVFAAGAAIFAGGIVTGDARECGDRFASAQSEFKRWTSDQGIETEWRTAIDFPAAALAQTASAADLIVVGSRAGSTERSANRSVDCGDLVMNAGRPVLTIPHGVAKLGAGGAVIAWKNTREARRALADALPLLAVAATVTLLHVGEAGEEQAPSLADAKAFLDGHGIGSEAVTLNLGGSGVAKQILEFAARSQAALIVAGAYGHSRVREWAFGGVTRSLLADCPIACLLSR
jgi:nucleotide-binding universal stress UspA family protein